MRLYRKKAENEAKKKEAEKTVEAANEAGSTADNVNQKIDEVIAESKKGRRVKRQDSSTTQTIKLSCEEFNTKIGNMNAEIKKNTADGFKKAAEIGAEIVSATVTCLKSEVNALESLKNEVAEAKKTVATAIIVAQNAIADAVQAINEAIAVIQAVIEELKDLGISVTFADPGSTYKPVTAPPLPTTVAVSPTISKETTQDSSTQKAASNPTSPGTLDATTPKAASSPKSPGTTPRTSTKPSRARAFFERRQRGSVFF